MLEEHDFLELFDFAEILKFLEIQVQVAPSQNGITKGQYRLIIVLVWGFLAFVRVENAFAGLVSSLERETISGLIDVWLILLLSDGIDSWEDELSSQNRQTLDVARVT